MKDPVTGKYLFEMFSYPTYYVSDTHHLALQNKSSTTDFTVVPNDGIYKEKKLTN